MNVQEARWIIQEAGQGMPIHGLVLGAGFYVRGLFGTLWPPSPQALCSGMLP